MSIKKYILEGVGDWEEEGKSVQESCWSWEDHDNLFWKMCVFDGQQFVVVSEAAKNFMKNCDTSSLALNSGIGQVQWAMFMWGGDGVRECTLRIRIRILTRPENSLANFSRQICEWFCE